MSGKIIKEMPGSVASGTPCIFISLPYMFRATVCPSSGVWSAGWSEPADQTPPIQSDKYQCRIGTAISSDDGHMVARNM